MNFVYTMSLTDAHPGCHITHRLIQDLKGIIPSDCQELSTIELEQQFTYSRCVELRHYVKQICILIINRYSCIWCHRRNTAELLHYGEMICILIINWYRCIWCHRCKIVLWRRTSSSCWNIMMQSKRHLMMEIHMLEDILVTSQFSCTHASLDCCHWSLDWWLDSYQKKFEKWADFGV